MSDLLRSIYSENDIAFLFCKRFVFMLQYIPNNEKLSELIAPYFDNLEKIYTLVHSISNYDNSSLVIRMLVSYIPLRRCILLNIYLFVH